jgi:uncharacterized damage-inducible protein DinB
MDALRTFFRHHAWATLLLIDHCAGLPPDALQETVPGTAGTILLTLTHLVAADQRYLRDMDGQEADPRVHERDEPPTLAVLRTAAEAQTARWEAVIDRANTLDVTLPARADQGETRHAEELVLLQAVHHGNDHRTHVCTILGANGREVPGLDGWHYWPHRPVGGPAAIIGDTDESRRRATLQGP